MATISHRFMKAYPAMTLNYVLFRIPWKMMQELNIHIIRDEYNEACQFAAQHEQPMPEMPDILIDKDTPEDFDPATWRRKQKGRASWERAKAQLHSQVQ